jgi:hypothetical protein
LKLSLEALFSKWSTQISMHKFKIEH